MNEPKRLLDSRSGHLRALVEAGKRDLPDRNVQENVLGALGLGSAGGGGLAVGASDRLARAGIGKFLHGLSRAAFSKVGIAVVVTATASSVGYLAGGAHEHARRVSTDSATPGTGSVPLRPSAPDPSTAGMPVTPSAAATSPPPAATAVPPFRAGAPNAGAATARATHARARHDALLADEAQETRAVPSMAAQLESIRRVHALIAAGDVGAALLELEAYETNCPHGSFEEEAIALRVRALRVAGDAAGAERARQNLRSRFPRSVHLATPGL